MKTWIAFVFLCFIVQWLPAQKNSTDPGDLEIDGLVIDHTRSRMGRDFYEQFYKYWQAPFGLSDYGIYIEEKPPRGNSATVEVLVNDRLVSVHRLQGRQLLIEEAAQAAVNRITAHLLNGNRLQKDLDAGDQAGSGIF